MYTRLLNGFNIREGFQVKFNYSFFLDIIGHLLRGKWNCIGNVYMFNVEPLNNMDNPKRDLDTQHS